MLQEINNFIGCASATRGILLEDFQVSYRSILNNIDYVTISSQGGANDFGDIYIKQFTEIKGANRWITRGIFSGW